MLKIFGFMIIAFFLISCSMDEENCEERSFFDECQTEEPTVGKLKINVTINSGNPQVKINIYEGDEYEKGILVLTEWIDEAEVNFSLPFGDYSGTALYYVGSDTILAVDSDDISKELEEYCDTDCWETTDGELDLTL